MKIKFEEWFQKRAKHNSHISTTWNFEGKQQQKLISIDFLEMLSSKSFLFSIVCVYLTAEFTGVQCKANMKQLLKEMRAKQGNIGFSFQNCGPSSDSFLVKKLSVLPDPLQLSGSINASGMVSIAKTINGPLSVLSNDNKI